VGVRNRVSKFFTLKQWESAGISEGNIKGEMSRILPAWPTWLRYRGVTFSCAAVSALPADDVPLFVHRSIELITSPTHADEL